MGSWVAAQKPWAQRMRDWIGAASGPFMDS
jgi:hypothetical protein